MQGTQLAVGTTSGTVQLWDSTKGKLVRELAAHRQRVRTLAISAAVAHGTVQVCAVAWNRGMLASGSRDRTIGYHDVRAPETDSRPAIRFTGHKQEVRSASSARHCTYARLLRSVACAGRLIRTSSPRAATTTSCSCGIPHSPHNRCTVSVSTLRQSKRLHGLPTSAHCLHRVRSSVSFSGTRA